MSASGPDPKSPKAKPEAEEEEEEEEEEEDAEPEPEFDADAEGEGEGEASPRKRSRGSMEELEEEEEAGEGDDDGSAKEDKAARDIVDDSDSATDEDAPLPAGTRTATLATVEEDEGDSHREPVHDGREATFPTESVNPYLMCDLCKGYLSNAHTIVECMHSFCFNCLLLHIGGQSVANPGWNPKYTCPKCNISLGSEPMDLIKVDPTIQNIVDKLFPDLMVAEREAHKKFCAEKGLPLPSFTEKLPNALIRRFIPESGGKPATILYGKPLEPEVAEPVVKRPIPPTDQPRKKRKSMPVTADTTKIRLVCLHGADGAPSDPRIRPLPRPLLQTSMHISMRHLKKFLMKRLWLDNEQAVEVLFKGRVMGDEHTLEFIFGTMGQPDGIPVLNYRAREHDMGM